MPYSTLKVSFFSSIHYFSAVKNDCDTSDIIVCFGKYLVDGVDYGTV